MQKSFSIHTTRLLEARPDLVASQSSSSAESSDDGFGPIKATIASPKQRNTLHLAATSGVSASELKVIEVGLTKIRDEVRSRIAIVNCVASGASTGPYISADWYQRAAMLQRKMGAGRQVDAYRITELMRQEVLQRNDPHLDVIVVDSDLTAHATHPGNSFVYGLNMYPSVVMSTARLGGRNAVKPMEALQSMSVIAAHELGHVYGLVNRNFNIGEGLYRGGHCNGERGPCLMEQVDVPGCKTVAEQTRLLIRAASWLCADCLEEAHFKKAHLEGQGVLW